MGRIVVYTCITDDYDQLVPPVSPHPDFDFICFVPSTTSAATPATVTSHSGAPAPISSALTATPAPTAPPAPASAAATSPSGAQASAPSAPSAAPAPVAPFAPAPVAAPFPASTTPNHTPSPAAASPAAASPSGATASAPTSAPACPAPAPTVPFAAAPVATPAPTSFSPWQIRTIDTSALPPAITAALNSSPYPPRHILSRLPKILPHLFLPEYEYSLWLDGNISIIHPDFYNIVLEKIASGSTYSGVRHWTRDCCYEELSECLHLAVETRRRILRTYFFMKRRNFPRHYGMYENNVILRRHNCPEIIRFDKMWWKFFTTLCCRDQTMHPYCLRASGLTFDWLLPPQFSARNHYTLSFSSHTSDRPRFWSRNVFTSLLSSILRHLLIR